MKYINFTLNQQTFFMKQVKEKSNLTWEKIAKLLKISRSMVFFYLNDYSKIPLENYYKLCNISKIKKSKIKTIEIKNKTEEIKQIKKITQELAELIGSLAGDGHLSHHNYEIVISGHKKLDKEYLTTHIKNIFIKLFNVNVKIKIQNYSNGMRIVVNSKKLMEYLTNEFKLPIGPKKGKLHIPSKIKNNSNLLKKYIRGLFDTDGSIYLKRKNSIVTSIISRDPSFLNEVKIALTKLGYTPSVSGKNLYIYSQKEVKKFFKDIKPQNNRHTKNYDKFINQ